MPATVDQNIDSVRAELNDAAAFVRTATALLTDQRPLAEVRGRVYQAIDALTRALDDLRVIEE